MELKLNVDINKLEREAVAKLHSELTRSINNMVYGMIDEAVRSRQTDQYGRPLRCGRTQTPNKPRSAVGLNELLDLEARKQRCELKSTASDMFPRKRTRTQQP